MPITPEHLNALSYHPLTFGRAELHERARNGAIALAGLFDDTLPPSREASLAFIAVQDALMWANAALAIHWVEPEIGITRHAEADPLVAEPGPGA